MADLAAFAFELGCGFVAASLVPQAHQNRATRRGELTCDSKPMPLFAPVLKMSIEKRAKLPNQMHTRERNRHRDP